MKIKLVLSVILVLSVALFFYSRSKAIENEKQTPSVNTSNGPNEFLIGAFANGKFCDFSGMSPLNFNLWQRYLDYKVVNGYRYPVGWNAKDTLGAPYWDYMQSVKDTIKRNADNGYYSIMQRPKIYYLAYGQRSDYQCESMSTSQTEWFHSYLTHQTGNDVPDSGDTVKYCDVNSDNAGYVVKDLIANREQCNFTWSDLYRDDSYDWYVEPRIRIPIGVGNNTPVCRIEIVNWEDSLVKTFELTGASFKNESGNYYGQYLDEFSRIAGNPYEPLTIKLSDSIKFNPHYHEWSDGNIPCHFDIRVYWYKQCNMWIDYVRMENNVAYDLFKGNHDDWIQWEAQYLGGYAEGKPFKFYADEMEYSHLPCVEYLNKKILQYSPNVSLTCVPYSAFNLLTRNRTGVGTEWISFSDEQKESKISQMFAVHFINMLANLKQ
jgi:hypothetical protein